MQVQYLLGAFAALLAVCHAFIVPQSDGSLTLVSPNEKFTSDSTITVNGQNLYSQLTSTSTYSSFVRTLYLSNVDSLLYQHINAYTPQDSVAVTVNGTTFLLIANGLYGQSQPIYKWNPSSQMFEYFQNVSVDAAINQDYEYFQYNGNHYIMLTNALSPNPPSYLLRFDGTTWQRIQNTTSEIANVYDCSFFTVGGTNYLAFANAAGVLIKVFNSSGYLSAGTAFSYSGSNAKDIETFTIGSNTYFALSLTSSVDIYQWTGSAFSQIQSIAATSAYSSKFISVGGCYFLAVAEGYTQDATSRIHQWNGTSFAVFQSIATQGASDVDTFTLGGNTYLTIASYQSTSSGLYAKSLIYKYNGNIFNKVGDITTRGATSIRKFSISGNDYLFITNDGTVNKYSNLYKLTY